MLSYTEKIHTLLDQINDIVLEKKDKVKVIFATWLMGGHVLLEDIPGTGKTILAKCFASSCDLKLGRVQFTPDLLPSDILGNTIYESESKKFLFRKGAIFSHFFLADEINRATPRTQSALLEAMAEKQITVENKTTKLPEVFFVMATQNPIESHGTFPLPEAQLDRFTIRTNLGFLSLSGEAKMIQNHLQNQKVEQLKPILNEEELMAIKNEISKVSIDNSLIEYIVKIITATRSHSTIQHGASARASLALTQLSQAYAYLSGRGYVIPSDIYDLVIPVLNHRVILTEEAEFEDLNVEDVLKEILKKTPAPKIK